MNKSLNSADIASISNAWELDNSNYKVQIIYHELIYNLTLDTHDKFLKHVNKIALQSSDDSTLITILEDAEVSDNARFISFYCLCIKYRRYKNFTKFNDILISYKYLFENEPIYWVEQAVYMKSFYNSNNELLEALRMWDSIEDRVKNMPCFIQAYTDTIALCFENDCLSSGNEKDYELLTSAIQLLEFACRQREYAKFYATLGRLHSINNEYELAINLVNIAIDKENSSSSDYIMRTNQYQTIISEIKIRRLYKAETIKFENQKSDIITIKEQIEKSKYDMLAFLGFFTALISFTIGSFTITADVLFVQRVQLLIILGGVILVSFSGLKVILNSFTKNWIDSLVIFLIGLLLIVLGLLIVPILI